VLWATSKTNVSSEKLGRRGVVVRTVSNDDGQNKVGCTYNWFVVVYFCDRFADKARQSNLGVTGIVLSQGGADAVRALSSLKVLVINGDASSSPATLFAALYGPSSPLNNICIL
jgi:hypothetical protein